MNKIVCGPRNNMTEVERILVGCVTSYYCASGLIVIDGQDGYGPLRDARVWIEANGSDEARNKLLEWKGKR